MALLLGLAAMPQHPIAAEAPNGPIAGVHSIRADDGLLPTLGGHESHVFSVALSPDGEILASGSWDDTVWLWRVSDGHLLSALEGHTAAVYGLAFSPDGKRLAFSSVDGTIRLWAPARVCG